MKDNQLLFDQTVAATWTDDISKSCKGELSLLPSSGQSKTINSGDKLEEAGTLQLRVLDEAGNSSSAEIKLTLSDTKAPDITLVIQEKNVVAGVKVAIQDNQLLFDQDIAASWKDDYSETFTIELSLTPDEGNQRAVSSGETIIEPGKLTLSVADEFQNKSKVEFYLAYVAAYGLENLQDKTLQVDQEVNILDGITFAEGLTLQKVEMVQGNDHVQIENPRTFKPEYSGSINIIFTLTRSDGSSIEVGVNNLTVKALDYTMVSIADMNPYDILPLYGIGPIEQGDINVYNYIDNLRIAEAMRIREMMGKYGAGGVNPEEYLQLMARLNYVMIREVPDSDKYNNFEWI